MSLLRTAMRSSQLMKFCHRNQGLASIPLHSLRHVSTEASEPGHQNPTDAFFRTPSTGLVYGKLTGIRQHTTKTDVLKLLDEGRLSLDDIKVDYNAFFTPMSMIIQFPSQEAYDAAVRSVVKKGRLFKLDRIDRTVSQWDVLPPYDGKTILLRGIALQAQIEELERFLSGCQYDSSSIQLLFRQAFPDPVRLALIRFPSQALAMHAFITKNRGFCRNSQISVQVLH